MRLIATDNVTVYGRALKAGEEFEVPDGEGNTWVLIGKAHEKGNKRGSVRPRKETPVFDGRYWRADLRAEDE